MKPKSIAAGGVIAAAIGLSGCGSASQAAGPMAQGGGPELMRLPNDAELHRMIWGQGAPHPPAPNNTTSHATGTPTYGQMTDSPNRTGPGNSNALHATGAPYADTGTAPRQPMTPAQIQLLLGMMAHQQQDVQNSTASIQNALTTDDGWTVVAKTTVSGTFNGCDYDLPVPLDGGYTFVCQEYNYHYAYRPDFIVMERQGARKYMIDKEEFRGTLYQGTPIVTHVMGEFQGCDFDRLIPLENGLHFKCRSYHYHYAYRPEVVIFGSTVSIDGEKYQGELSQG